MHFCTAHIMLGGDKDNVMARGLFNPVSWPEVSVLRVIHGDESIIDVEPFVEVKQSPRSERGRLAFIYGEQPLGMVWGGKNAPDEMEAPKVKLKAGVTWRNPLTSRTEVTTKDGSEPVDETAPAVPPMQATETEDVVETVGDPSPAPVEVDNEDDPFAEDGALPEKKPEPAKKPAAKPTAKKR
jgi:hypothetical protein